MNSAPLPPPPSSTTPAATLFDFAEPLAIACWQPIGDRVMGGLSSGALQANDAGCAEFCGTVSLANGGGFASVRSLPGHWDLSAWSGLRLIVRGDGRPYKLSLMTDAGFDSVLYQSRFETLPGEWQTIDLPFSGFVARRRGRPVAGAPELDPAAIRAFGLMTELRLPGPFALELRALLAIDGKDGHALA